MDVERAQAEERRHQALMKKRERSAKETEAVVRGMVADVSSCTLFNLIHSITW